MIGIVGGGASGLLLLHNLVSQGTDAILLETSDRPGGVMSSRTLEGPRGRLVADLGPQRVRLTAGLARLTNELGLEGDVVRATAGLPFTVLREGRLHTAPMSLGDAVRTRLISRRGKARALADLVTPAPRADESVEAALSRKLGPEIYEYLAGPILGGLYASHPSRMRAADTLIPVLRRTGARRSLLAGLLAVASREHPPVVSFRRGMGQLTDALAARHRDRVLLASPVERIVPRGEGFRIVAPGGSIDVEQVALTLPAPAAGPLVQDFDPDFAGALAGLRYNPLAVVPLVVVPDHDPPDVGSGYKVPLGDPAITRGVTSHDALFSRDGLFTAFLGGMGFEAATARPDEELMDAAASDFLRATGAPATPLFVHRTAMPAWDETWDAIRGRTPPRGVHVCAAFSGRPGLAGRIEEADRLAARLARGGEGS